MAICDDTLDARILAELAKDAGTLLELAIRLETDTGTLLRRLQLLGSLKRVQCTREDGRLLWERLDEEGEPATAEQPRVEHVEHRGTPVPAPAPARIATTVTDRMRAVLANATDPVSPAQLVAALPDVRSDSIYAILSQRVRAGEFVAIPIGKSRRYMLASRVTVPIAAPAPQPPAPRASKPAIFQHSGLWWCIRQVAADVLDMGAGDSPSAAFQSMNEPGERSDLSIDDARIARALRERFALTHSPAAPAPKEHTMTHRYIGTKEVMAWQEERDGQSGYAVSYADGYTSWSPKDVFEAAYRVAEGDDQRLTFGDAVHFLKAGRKVTRAGWNGKGMFVYLVPAASYPVQTGAARSHFGEGSVVPYRAYLALKTTDGDVATWAPSCSDALAEDWQVID